MNFIVGQTAWIVGSTYKRTEYDCHHCRGHVIRFNTERSVMEVTITGINHFVDRGRERWSYAVNRVGLINEGESRERVAWSDGDGKSSAVGVFATVVAAQAALDRLGTGDERVVWDGWSYGES